MYVLDSRPLREEMEKALVTIPAFQGARILKFEMNVYPNGEYFAVLQFDKLNDALRRYCESLLTDRAARSGISLNIIIYSGEEISGSRNLSIVYDGYFDSFVIRVKRTNFALPVFAPHFFESIRRARNVTAENLVEWLVRTPYGGRTPTVLRKVVLSRHKKELHTLLRALNAHDVDTLRALARSSGS